jgi:uncharacterized protein (DUF2126 family)
VDQTIQVTRPHTIVYGMGLATIVPENGVIPMQVADVDGVKVSGLLFNVNPTVNAYHAFEVPVTPGVQFHDLLTVSLGGVGTITHVINDTGATAQGTSTTPVNIVSYP